MAVRLCALALALLTLVAPHRTPMPITTIYGPQDWSAGTFNVTGTPDSGDANYAFVNYREEVKTVDAAGPNGERIIDSDDYGASALDEENFGPSSGAFDIRGANDGTGCFYEGDVKFSSAAEAVLGNFFYPINVHLNALIGTPFMQLRVALTEGKIYIAVRGDGEDDTGAAISADDSWHTIKIQIVPSSDEGSTADGIVRVWIKDSSDPASAYTLLYENLASFAWIPATIGPFMANYLAYGHFGLLPVTNWTIYYGAAAAPDVTTIPQNGSTPCCGSGGPGAVGGLLPNNPYQALQPWTPSCGGGGTVPSASDLTDAEDWSV